MGWAKAVPDTKLQPWSISFSNIDGSISGAHRRIIIDRGNLSQAKQIVKRVSLGRWIGGESPRLLA